MTTHLWDMNNIARKLLEANHTLRSIYQLFYSSHETNILVWDGKNSLKTRREIFPNYKRRERTTPDDLFINFDMIKAVLTFTSAVQVEVPGHEADDVIAHLVGGRDVHIHSTDRDFLQLGVPCDANPIPGVEAHQIRLYKTFVGDSSDAIPGCPGFGHGAWEKSDPDALHAWLHDGADCEFPKRCRPDREQLLTYWQIIGFLPVEIEDEHVRAGQCNAVAAEAFFKEFML